MRHTKSTLIYSLIFIGSLLIISCSKDSGGGNATLGGDTNLAANKVGTTTSGSVKVGSSTSFTAQTKVLENAGGIITTEFKVSVPKSLETKYKTLARGWWGEDFTRNESKLIDAQGLTKINLKIKNSSEGVAIINKKGDQAVIMKYDVKVGDSWSYKKKNGEQVKMSVTHKSSADDFDYSGFRIKVVKVERASKEPGVTKVIYIGNHKFGLVGIELYLEDGTTVKYSL